MKIITVSNQKGGTGKTALTFELGSILAKEKRVLFIDLDGQRDLTKMLTSGKEAPNAGALEVIKGDITAQEGITDRGNNIALLPATEDLLKADNVLINQGGNVSGKLKRALLPLKEYDYIVIDTPPKLGTLTLNALTAADYIYIPTLAESNSIDGLINFIKTVTLVNKVRTEPARLGGIVVMRYNGRSVINRQMMETIEEIGELVRAQVFPIKETVKLREAHFFKQSITDYAPKTDTAKQFRELPKGIE